MAAAIARVERTPETLAGICVLGNTSMAIGAGLQIASGPNRHTRGNLYLVGSAESGSGKSETFRHAARPLHEFERDLVERWKMSTLPGLDADKDMIEARINQLRKEAGRAEGGMVREEIRSQLEKAKADLLAVATAMQAPVLTVEDVTSQKLAGLLAKRGETLASLSADAGAIVNNLLGQYSKLDRTDESIYLKSFSGDFCRVDRQSGEPVLLREPCLAALWLTQPDKVETLLGERSLADGGLIPRLLICHTRAEARPITEDDSGIPAAVAGGYSEMIRDLLTTFRLAKEAKTIEPEPAARRAMNDYFNRIVERRRSDLKDVSTYAARWGEQAWRIAVVIHAGLHGKTAGEHRLQLETAERAIELAEWFAGQQLEILSKGRHAARQSVRDEVLALLADNPAQGITARDVHRARITPTAPEARELLEAMEREGSLTGKDSKPDHGGHVTRTYTKARR